MAGITWSDGFAVGYGTHVKSVCCLLLKHYKPALKQDGKRRPWGVEKVDYAADKKTILRILERRLFSTEQAAKNEWEKWKAELKAHEKEIETKLKKVSEHKPSRDEEDLSDARRKVMREQYPDTFKALDELAQANPKTRNFAIEAVFRAYQVDFVRLHKPDNIPAPFGHVPTDINFFLEIAKAYKAESPYDPVDEEIAARWFAAGYDKMSCAEYTEAINAKTGADLKTEAMKKRRYKKLGLMANKSPGPPPKA